MSPSLEVISALPTHLLAAMYAAALPFCPYDDYLCVQNGYRLPEAANLWRIVQDELPVEIHTPHLSTIQACMLYIQRPPTLGTTAAADTPFVWSLFGSVVAQATSIGLHLDCRGWHLPAWEKRLRRRLWWAIFIEDKFRCMLRGVPSLISDDAWDVSELTDEDFTLSYRAPNTVIDQDCGLSSTNFHHLASLALTMADIHTAF